MKRLDSFGFVKSGWVDWRPARQQRRESQLGFLCSAAYACLPHLQIVLWICFWYLLNSKEISANTETAMLVYLSRTCLLAAPSIVAIVAISHVWREIIVRGPQTTWCKSWSLGADLTIALFAKKINLLLHSLQFLQNLQSKEIRNTLLDFVSLFLFFLDFS